MGLRNGTRWGSHRMRGCHAKHLINISDHDHETMHRNPGRGGRVALGLVRRLQLRDHGWQLRHHLWHLWAFCMGAASFCRPSAARSTEAALDATGHGRSRDVAYETPWVCMMSRWRLMSGQFPFHSLHGMPSVSLYCTVRAPCRSLCPARYHHHDVCRKCTVHHAVPAMSCCALRAYKASPGNLFMQCNVVFPSQGSWQGGCTQLQWPLGVFQLSPTSQGQT